MRYFFCCIIFTFFFLGVIKAAPFDTGFVQWTQPNSVTFIARYWGDEFKWYMETQEGYRIIRGSTGWYYYATLNEYGDYSATNSRVGIDSPPPQGSYKLERSQQCIYNIDQQIENFYDNIEAAAAWFKQKQQEAGSNPVILNIGVIFVQFADVPHYVDINNPNLIYGYQRVIFENMLFSQNYWIGTQGNNIHPEGDAIFGSMRDYWYQMSQGKLILNGTMINPTDEHGVPIWLTIGNRSNYIAHGSVKSDGFAAALYAHQTNPNQWPDPNGFDRYIYVYAQDDCGWDLTHAGDCTFIQVPERMGKYLHTEQNLAFAHMGTYCHEFGHNIGFDEEYGSGSASTVSTTLYSYSLMAFGIYNGKRNKGECPATLEPYYRIRVNWIVPTLLTQNTSNLTIVYNYSNPNIYRIDPIEKTSPTEHYLFECRGRQGFDQYVPNAPENFQNQTGTLLVWHHDVKCVDIFDQCIIIPADNTRDTASFLTDFFPNNTSPNSQDFNEAKTRC